MTKLEAAERQLAEAIHFFFEERDPFAIHTLASAAGQVTADLLKGSRPDLDPPKRANDQGRLVAPEKFLKHADRDPKAVLEFEMEQLFGPAQTLSG